MRKIKTNLILVTIFCLSSCSDFLDRKPLDQLTQENFYSTANEAELATISIYAILQNTNWYGKSWMMTEIPADNTTSGGNDPDFSPIDNFTISADNIPNSEFWSEHYKLITFCNQIIGSLPKIDMDEKRKASLIGEAQFLRAFSYFDLVRIYGDVPIVKEVATIATDLMVRREPIAKVYEFIESDLIAAIQTLPLTRGNAELGRSTSYAAKALLAKAYLTNKKYDDAAKLCREIIASNQYKLVADYADNWLRDVSDNNVESIFQVQYIGCGPGGTGNALQAFFAPWGQGITKGSDGWGSQIPTSPTVDNPGTTIKDAFVKEDKRKYHSIMTPGDFYPMINSGDGGYTYPATGASRSSINIKKYVIGGGSDVCFMSSPQNFHVIRYADVLLTLAEAACSKNGGISNTPDVVAAFNAIRLRAGLKTEDLVTSDKVLEERRREFAFENQRWFDLLRSGKAKTTMQLHGKQMQDFHVLFPIPSQELAINPNLTQNTGY
jgi:starch-binding outer membrane protein, SusD/RagB family